MEAGSHIGSREQVRHRSRSCLSAHLDLIFGLKRLVEDMWNAGFSRKIKQKLKTYGETMDLQLVKLLKLWKKTVYGILSQWKLWKTYGDSHEKHDDFDDFESSDVDLCSKIEAGSWCWCLLCRLVGARFWKWWVGVISEQGLVGGHQNFQM